MAFDFNNAKSGSASGELQKSIQKLSSVELCKMERDCAKEQGNIWLMFYFHFLKNLYEAANSQQCKVSTIHPSLAKRPENTLIALQMLIDKYKEIAPYDINAIEHVIEVMKLATAPK